MTAADPNTLCDRHGEGAQVYYDPEAHPAGCPWCAMIDAHAEELRETEEAAHAETWAAKQRADKAARDARRAKEEADTAQRQHDDKVRRMKKDAETREWNRRLGLPW